MSLEFLIFSFTTAISLAKRTTIRCPIISVISLNGERMMIVCKIIACEKSQKVSDKYINRAKFIFKNISDREKIVRFVFDEERKARQREVGE